MKKQNFNKGEIIIYKTPQNEVELKVYFEKENVWLTQNQIALLFGTQRPAIAKHLKNIFESGELKEKVVSSILEHTTEHGAIKGKTQTRNVKFYNLDAIISVGYRVNSQRATQFRMWATQRLKEYIIKGFALDDERLKQGGERARYFEELLQRVRDIRSSERNFYQKVTDIYTTSIDYRKDDTLTQEFFATVQNKMHFAVHGHTAAEIINERANSQKPMMGLTNFKGKYITAGDIKIAKNYLLEKELKQLNLIVSLYLDFAELQASNERPMKMKEWVSKLDEFLKLSEKKLLTNAGKIGAEKASSKAEAEFAAYKKEQDKKYISDFDHEVKKIDKTRKLK